MSIHSDILDAVKTGLEGLLLEGFASPEVVIRDRDDDPTNHGITISPFDDNVSAEFGTNSRDDIGYGVKVVVRRGSLGSRDTAKILDWKEKIRKTFHNNLTAFTGVSAVWQSTIERPNVDTTDKTKDAFQVVVRVWTRENRVI